MHTFRVSNNRLRNWRQVQPGDVTIHIWVLEFDIVAMQELVQEKSLKLEIKKSVLKTLIKWWFLNNL